MRIPSEKMTALLLILLFLTIVFVLHYHNTRFTLQSAAGSVAYKFDRKTGQVWLVTPQGIKSLWSIDPVAAGK